ncbi:MAG: hypothetical protein ACKVIN_04695, partial [Longimicrobiales bacterium]
DDDDGESGGYAGAHHDEGKLRVGRSRSVKGSGRPEAALLQPVARYDHLIRMAIPNHPVRARLGRAPFSPPPNASNRRPA